MRIYNCCPQPPPKAFIHIFHPFQFEKIFYQIYQAFFLFNFHFILKKYFRRNTKMIFRCWNSVKLLFILIVAFSTFIPSLTTNAINELSVTDAAKIIHFFCQDYEKVPMVRNAVMKGFEHEASFRRKNILHTLNELKKNSVSEIAKIHLQKIKLSEDEQFRFILSRLYAFARVVTIQFLKCEGKTMDLLADENKRLDVHKYVNLLDKFDRTTAKLLNLLQNRGHRQQNLESIHSKVVNYAVVKWVENEENHKFWYTMDKKKKFQRQGTLSPSDIMQLLKLFNQQEFDKLGQSNQMGVFENFFDGTQNIPATKAVYEFVLEKANEVISDLNFAYIKNTQDITYKLGDELLSYQEQNVLLLATIYKFAMDMAKGLLEKLVKPPTHGNNKVYPIRERKKRTVGINEITNERAKVTKFEDPWTQSHVLNLANHDPKKWAEELPKFQTLFKERFEALKKVIAGIHKVTNGVELVDSMDYAKFFKIEDNNFGRAMTRNFWKFFSKSN